MICLSKRIITLTRTHYFAVETGGIRLIDRNGNITTSNYPSNYNDEVMQKYHIKVPKSHIVMLKFHDFKTEVQDGSGKKTDFFRVNKYQAICKKLNLLDHLKFVIFQSLRLLLKKLRTPGQVRLNQTV